MIVDAGTPARSRRARRRRVELGALLRRLDWCCCSRPARSSATGSGRSRGSRASTSPATRTTSSCGRRSRRRSAWSGSSSPIAIPPSLYRRHWRVVYGGALALMVLRLVVRGGGARLEALDRHRPVPVPAVRVREAAVRPRDRRLPRRARAAARAAPDRRSSAIGARHRADAARLHAARPRDGARLRRRARRGAVRRGHPLAPPGVARRARARARRRSSSGWRRRPGSRCSSRTRRRV